MTKTTRFEWFERGHGSEAVQLGIINPGIFARYIRYKVYLDLIAQGISHNESINLTADRNRCSYTTVWRDIQFFQDNAKDIADLLT